MSAQFFDGCKTSEDVRNEYRRLCKLWHPDLGPREDVEKRTQVMQEINAAYARASATYRQEEMRDKARQRNRPEPTQQDYTDAAAVDERIRAAIEKIITLEGLEIEICGLWVWVGGTTRPHKHELKAAGYSWAAQKGKWYFAGVPAGGFRAFDMDEIRDRYGSQRVFARSRTAVEVRDG